MGLKVAILIEDGFEQVEMVEPRKALDQAGARRASSRPGIRTSALGTTRTGETCSRSTSPSTKPSRRISTRSSFRAAYSIPMRCGSQPKAVAFAKAFFDAGKPVNRLLDSPKVEPGLQILRYQSRPLLLRLEQAHRHPVENHVDNQVTGRIGHDQRDLVSNGCQLVEERDSRSVFFKGYVPCKLLRKAHI